MFDSSIIDAGIGLVFVYLLLSTAVTAAKEGLEAVYKRRGQYLERGIKELVGCAESATNDPNSPEAKFVSSLYNHPFINSLFAGPYSTSKKANLPSYIPSANFALALLDLRNQSVALAPAAGDAPADADALKVILPDKVKKAFAAFEKTFGDDKDKLLSAIGDWYNSSMDRVSGWYKRHTQWWILMIAVVVTIGVNADSVLIAKRLSTDKTLREAAVSAAQNELKNSSLPPDASAGDKSSDHAIATIKAKLTDLDGVGFPIGWQSDLDQWKRNNHSLTNCSDVLQFAANTYPHFAGWLVTILAIMLGAPFWFDVLNKFMVVRSTVKPREKSGEEKSKDGTDQ